MKKTKPRSLKSMGKKTKRSSKADRNNARFASKLIALHKHALQLNSANTLSSIVECTLDAMQLSLGFDHADVAIVENQRLHMIGYRGERQLLVDLRLDGRGVTVRAANSKVAVKVPDTRKEPAYVDGRGSDWKGLPRMRSELAVPALADDQTVAVLNVESEHLNAFTDDDQLLLETLASHIASAISRLRREEAYRTVAQHTPLGLTVIQDQRIVFANQALLEMSGYSLEETLSLQPEGVMATIHPEDRERAWLGIQDLLAGKQVRSPQVLRLIRRNGSVRWVEARATRIEHQGKPAIQITYLDVTQRRRAEEKLRESEELYRLLIERQGAGLGIVDPQERFVFCNPAGEAIFGVPPGGLTGRTLRDFTTPESFKMLGKETLNRLAGKGATYELEIIRPNGGKRLLRVTAEPWKGEDGQINGTTAIFTDETERKQAEERLRESEERYRLLIERQREGLIVVDLEEGVLFCNPAGEEVFGVPPGGLIGRNLSDFTNPTTFQILKKETQNRIAGKSSTYEVEIARPNGEKRILFAAATPWMDRNGRIIGSLGIFRDVTEQKLMEAALHRRAEQLAALEETLLEITSRHELPKLLNSIVERAAGLLGATSGGLYLCDHNRREVRCAVAYNTKTNPVGTVLKYGEGAAGVVAETGKPLIISDYRTWLNRAVNYEADQPFGAIVSAPMIWQGEVIGVIHVLRYDEKHFTEQDLELLSLFANHAAIAVENERFYEQLDRHATQLERMVEDRTRKLTESETRYRRLFENSPVSLWEEDFSEVKMYMDDLRRSGVNDLRRYFEEHPEEVAKCASNVKILNVNRATLGLYGAKSVEELLGGLDKVLAQESQTDRHFREELVALGEGRTRFGSEFDNQTLTGEIRHVSLILTVVPGYENTLGKVLVSIIDLTQQKDLEKAIQSAYDQLDYVLSTNPAAVFLEKPRPDLSDMDPTFVSKSVITVFGFNPEDLLGRQGTELWQSRLHPEDLERYMAEFPSLWSRGYHSFEFRFLHKDGTYHWIREDDKVNRDAKGQITNVVGVNVDVTERKQLEEKLARSQRLAAIGETAAMVGHDLRNPMQGISGATYALRSNSLTKEQRDQMLQLIDDSVDRSNRIISDLLDYSREFRLEPVEVTPQVIVRRALEAANIPGSIAVQDQTQDHPVVCVDSEKLKRVFINLIGNAVDAMPNGGTLTVTSKESSGFVEFAVSDTGTGVDKCILDNLWKPLQTTKQKGMGLGLPIVKRLIDAHNGEITVVSNPGKGTTFTIRLPIKPTI